ncbi:MAG: radical SAM protein [Candidatus Omnitrophica bacterium]|nr:radical SAM protein [Candidatus Omnitrophota bacterium]
MKVVLIDPRLSAKDEYGSLKDVSNIIPNLGLAYIASALRNRGYDVKIVDCSVSEISLESLKDICADYLPDVFGFTATVLSIQSACKAAEYLKVFFPDSLFVIGGPQVTALPFEVMNQKYFDVGVLGEGEDTVLELLDCFSLSEDGFSKVPGLIYWNRQQAAWELSPKREYISDLNRRPFPARDLFVPLNRYSYSPVSTLKSPCCHIISSRGCPYSCSFCDKSVTGSVFRARNASDIVDEIEHLIKDFKVKEIKFFDDNFAFDSKRVFDLCDLILKKKINISWTCVVHANTVSYELLRRMKMAGCWQVVFGLESGNQKILDSVSKPLTLDISARAIRLAKRLRMNTRATFILGLPGETSETIRQTLSFAKKLNIDTVSFYVFSPYPGSVLFKDLEIKGQLRHRNYQYYRLIIDQKNHCLPYVPEGLTEEALTESINYCYRAYYLRFAYVFRQLADLLNFYQLRRYLRCLRPLFSIFKER